MNILRTPRAVDVAITNNCNLRCKYCYHFESEADAPADACLSDWLSFFEELARCAVMEVNLSGGEAFLREDLKEIINGIIKNKMRFKVLSNGTLINDEIASFLASTGRCNGVQVSVDGSTPEAHDCFRGKGTLKKVMNGIKILQKHGIRVFVLVTIHKKNYTDLENIAKLLLEDYGLPGFSVNSAYDMGLCRRNSKVVGLSARERSEAMERILKLSLKYKNQIRATAGPLAQARRWREMMKSALEKLPAFAGGGFLSGCRGVFDKIAVRADGVIIPCHQLSHIKLGRINERSLHDLWQNHPELNRLRKRIKIPLSSFKLCQDCPYINYCTGSCPGLAYQATGSDERPNPADCLRSFLANGGRLPDESL